MSYSSLLGWASFIQTAAAQAPVSDLTGYPSGLASIAVGGYYAVSSDKDVLPHRRRVAGMGMEHIARDRATGPRKGKDAQLKGIVISRRSAKHQRTAWARVMCGKSSDVNGVSGVHFLDGDEIIKRCANAFVDLPLDVQELLENKVSWVDEGHWLTATVLSCCISVNKQ